MSTAQPDWWWMNCGSPALRPGLLRLRWLRPFPAEEVAALGERVRALGVLEKNISFGFEGAVFSEVNSGRWSAIGMCL